MNRRQFLKVMGLAGSMAAVGCDSMFNRYVPYIDLPGDVIPGFPTWFATTCRECPAGCGMIVKNRDRRVIKVEGNHDQPISRGKLCPRGQASLHGLYNPDRFRGPLLRDDSGALRPISWNDGLNLLADQIRTLKDQGRGDRIVLLTGLINGTLAELAEFWLGEIGGGRLMRYNSYAYEPLRKANQMLFGRAAVPMYDVAGADFLISLGADFLETWVSNLQYAREFARFHEPRDDHKNLFVYVGPRHSLTAANADHQIIVRPGEEYLIALALLRTLIEKHPPQHLPEDRLKEMRSMVEPFGIDAVAGRTGTDRGVIEAVARRWSQATKPMALAGGAGLGPNALDGALAANLLLSAAPDGVKRIDFGRACALGEAATAAEMRQLSERMERGEVELLMIHDANPVFTLPKSWGFTDHLKKVPLVVSFSSAPDETMELAKLILPAHHYLEEWGDYEPQKGLHCLMQPVMGPIFQTRPLGDILLQVGRRIEAGPAFAAPDFRHVLQASWKKLQERLQPDQRFEEFWLQAVKRGGMWEEPPASGKIETQKVQFAFAPLPDKAAAAGEFEFTAYPTIQFYDGRMANHLWIQELPDPLTQATWGGWLEMHPQDARSRGLARGSLVTLQSAHGQVDVPVLPTYTVPPGRLAMPIGQGHTHYGRYASGLPANPLALYPAGVDDRTGGPAVPALTVSLHITGGSFAIAHTDGNYFDLRRDIFKQQAFHEFLDDRRKGKPPEVDEPLPEGYKRKKDIYPPHLHETYRWCMVVDLDRCIGCGACVVACYAENNVAVVGREPMLRQREMSWIRVQRYFSQDESHRARFLIMLCQHCDEAPCEAVCPVFAPNHDIEGLNEQVYNRCIGTRDCSQNDPYKVRRFNWYTFVRPWPLDLQLNPDVTVRMKGVMEKCSFCVQRIVHAKSFARDRGRLVKDGDFTTACAQTCPTDALIFGSLLDPQSKVSQLIKETRAYQVLRELNTKPAAVYLKKLTVDLEKA